MGLLDKYKAELKKQNIDPKQYSAHRWFKNKIKNLRVSDTRRSILNDSSRTVSNMELGKMYFYRYFPKHKDTLPEWDMYPLVIPINVYGDGFLGLNLHYLDGYSRVILLDRLMDFMTNDKYDDTTRLLARYEMLNASPRYSLFKPCVHRYLFEYIGSNIIYIEPESWETAMYLPTQRFINNR
jgi:hypothetical protein